MNGFIMYRQPKCRASGQSIFFFGTTVHRKGVKESIEKADFQHSTKHVLPFLIINNNLIKTAFIFSVHSPQGFFLFLEFWLDIKIETNISKCSMLQVINART